MCRIKWKQKTKKKEQQKKKTDKNNKKCENYVKIQEKQTLLVF
jgi:hypothetical protein